MRLMQHLPALQVVIPLLAAPICAILRHPFLAWAWATLVSAIAVVIAALILAQVLRGGPISYWIGSWEPPWGIEYRIDTLNAFVLLLVSVIGAVVTPYARVSLAHDLPRDRLGWYYTMYLLCLAGLLGMTATGDAFNVFVFMEIASLSSYVLIGLGRDRRALLAAYQYLIVGTIGATFYVIGVGFLYLVTGTLNIADLAARLPAVTDQKPVAVGLAFIAVGLSLKFALYPLHAWLPGAYANAPVAATAFLAATATKVAAYLLLRFFFTIFGETYQLAELTIPTLWVVASITAMILASWTAVYQVNVRRMLAFSSVAQIGVITLGIGLGSIDGLTGSITHLFNHAITKGALFLLVGGVVMRLGSATVGGMAGLGRHMPLTMVGFTIAAASLIGVPGTAGFIGKWYLVLAAIERGWWWLVFAIMLSSLLAVIYLGRVLESVWLRPAPTGTRARDMPLSMLVPAWILVIGCVWFGLDTDLTAGIARRAATELLGRTP